MVKSNCNKKVLLIIGIIVGILLIWGFIGGVYADDLGTTCNFGVFSDNLCWFWERNGLGQLVDKFN